MLNVPCVKCGSTNTTPTKLSDHIGVERAVKIWLFLVVATVVSSWVGLRQEMNLWGALLVMIPSIWIAAPVGGLLLAALAGTIAWLSTLGVKGMAVHCASCGYLNKIGDTANTVPPS